MNTERDLLITVSPCQALLAKEVTETLPIVALAGGRPGGGV